MKYNNKQTYKYAINSMDYLSDMELAMGGDDSFVSIWKY